MRLGVRKIERDMERAASYQEWYAAALAHDQKTGNDRWRRMDASRQFASPSAPAWTACESCGRACSGSITTS